MIYFIIAVNLPSTLVKSKNLFLHCSKSAPYPLINTKSQLFTYHCSESAPYPCQVSSIKCTEEPQDADVIPAETSGLHRLSPTDHYTADWPGSYTIRGQNS